MVVRNVAKLVERWFKMGSSLLGSLSPVYGAVTGEGAYGKLADSGLGGILPSLLSQQRKKEEEEKARQGGAPTGTGMKKGGKVSSASKRADGIAQRGKTKGRMV